MIKKFSFFIIFAFAGTLLYSQNYHFVEYGVEKGLCDNFIYNINQDDNAYLWMGTGEGLCRFDGFNFVNEFKGDSLPDSPVMESYKDSKGRVWFGYDNGQIAILRGLEIKLITPPEDHLNSINGIVENADGEMIFATQNKGLIRIGQDFELSYYQGGLGNQFISAINLTSDGDLLLGTFDGLFLYRFSETGDELELAGRFEEIPYTNIQLIIPARDENSYWIGTRDEGLYHLHMSGRDIQSASLTKIGEEFGLAYADIQDVLEDEDKNLWISLGGEGIVHLMYSGVGNKYSGSSFYNEANGLVSRYIRDIFEDIEGNLWFASYGSGLSVLKERAFSFFELEHENFGSNILSLVETANEYWLGGATGILVLDREGRELDFLDGRNGLPDDQIISLRQDLENIWVGTSENGLYQIDKKSKRARSYFSSRNSLENTINDIEVQGEMLWIATNGGVISFNLNTGERRQFTTYEGLPHNKVRDIYIDRAGDIWIATRSNGLYSITLREELAIDIRAELEFVSITQDQQGNLWAATSGDGVFEFRSDSLLYYSAADGLRSNYCYSIIEDVQGNIWIGHRLGMSRIDTENDNIQVFSVDEGISADCNHNAVIENGENRVAFGTTNGVIFYDPAAEEADTIPPQLNITALTISDRPYDFTEPVDLPYGTYKIRIEFIGINLTNPDKVRYQYKLEGYDEEWSEPSIQSYAYYPRVEDGDYTFLLRACDEGAVCTEVPLRLDIDVKIPVWKTWWFILSSILLLIGIVYLIIKIRERKQKQLQEFLQKSLDERTREVMEQKEEIENKNRDITDSINYAQRIQASILPPIKRLQDSFSGSFVFYQPRDIVSGDFYWYDKIWNNKFVIVCADSTGHGVPGAFMSMIGTTLIKDICSRPDVNSPSGILRTLDEEVHTALNQNVEAERSNDGMDIIVAEFDMDTNYLRVASAMRPIILYIGGEQVYVKGTRNSVGGHFDDEVDDKEFRDEEFQMNKGDLIYMFSDGYPDQFGGPLGKKFKMVRLKNLLRDIHDKPMDEQYNYVKSNFQLWKEDLEQVDDVLFMGIKI